MDSCPSSLEHSSSGEVRGLGDLITNLDCTIEAAHRFWDQLNYLGVARVLAELHVEPLPLLERAGGLQAAYASCFYEKAGATQAGEGAHHRHTDASLTARRNGNGIRRSDLSNAVRESRKGQSPLSQISFCAIPDIPQAWMTCARYFSDSDCITASVV